MEKMRPKPMLSFEMNTRLLSKKCWKNYSQSLQTANFCSPPITNLARNLAKNMGRCRSQNFGNFIYQGEIRMNSLYSITANSNSTKLFKEWEAEDEASSTEQRADAERVFASIETNGIPKTCI